MNLHQRVRPPYPRVEFTLIDNPPRGYGRLARIAPGTLHAHSPGRFNWERIFYRSTNRRKTTWTCPVGYIHKRYWLQTTRSWWRTNQTDHACEHTATLHPTTGLPC